MSDHGEKNSMRAVSSRPSHSGVIHATDDEQTSSQRIVREDSASGLSRSLFFSRFHSSKEVNPPVLNPYGLNLLTQNINHSIANVVFIHGLGGGSVKTWCHKRDPSNFWPALWLPTEVGFENVRIYTFGYPADILKSESTNCITDFAKKLNQELFTADLQHGPIILVCHSMGGLVAKKAYMLARLDHTFAEVSSKITLGGIIFIATPHRGSGSAANLSRFLSTVSKSKTFIQELMRNSGTLQSINEEFRHYRDLEIWSFYETLPTVIAGIPSIVVDKDSATMGYDREGSSYLDADHHTVCKFFGREDPNYRSVRDMLKKFLQKSRQPWDMIKISREPSKPYSRTDVMKLLGQGNVAEDDLLSFSDARLPDSCQWIRGKQSFEWWLKKDEILFKIMWLKGRPATGKSILLTSIIEMLQLSSQNYAYYFFRFNDAGKRTTKSLLLTLVFQMAIVDLEFFQRLLHIEEEISIQKLSTRVLWQRVFIESLFEIGSSHTWFWVIDALDEADDPLEVLTLLGKVSSRCPIKILVSSRPSLDFERSFQKLNIVKKSFMNESLEASDTLNDIKRYCELQLEPIGLESAVQEDLVLQILAKCQGIFLWVKFAMKEITSAHTLSAMQDALRDIPTEMNQFFQRIMDTMSKSIIKPADKALAKAILECVLCSHRPLHANELQAFLSNEFKDLIHIENSVSGLCPYLLFFDENHAVHPIHQTVRDFLLNDVTSDFPMDVAIGNRRLALACIDSWQDGVSKRSLDITTKSSQQSSLGRTHPIMKYSVLYWYKHAANATIDNQLVKSLVKFLKGPVLSWIEMVGVLNDLVHLTNAATSLENILVRSKNISKMDQSLIGRWALDLARLPPRFGWNLVRHPFSIHKLLPAFFPSHTAIGSQFGTRGDIAVIGSSTTHWDDSLAHLTVGRDRERCKTLVCGNTYLVVGLAKGTIVVYHAQTCAEYRRIINNERISCLALGCTEQFIVCGGPKYVRVFDVQNGRMKAEYNKPTTSFCLAITFRRQDDQIVYVTADNILNLLDRDTSQQRHFKWSFQSSGPKYRGAPWYVCFSPDGSLVSLAYKGWPLEIWDIDNIERIHIPDLPNPVTACFSPDNRYVFASSGGGLLKRLDMVSNEVEEIFPEAYNMACSADSSMIATGHGKRVEVRDVQTFDLLYCFNRYDDSINGLAFGPDGTRLYYIRYFDCNVWVLDGSTRQLAESPTSPLTRPTTLQNTSSVTDKPRSITVLAPSPNGDIIACGTVNGKVCLYESATGRQQRIIYEYSIHAAVRALAWSRDASRLAMCDIWGGALILGMREPLLENGQIKVIARFSSDDRLDAVFIRQLLFDESGTRLLVSSKLSDRMFNLNTSESIGKDLPRPDTDAPMWITHPSNSEYLIMMCSHKARIYHWLDFSEKSSPGGIILNYPQLLQQGKEFQIEVKAFITQDQNHIVTMIAPKDRSFPKRISFWRANDFSGEASSVEEYCNLNDVDLDNLVGVFENAAVFLDRDLWLCSKQAGAGALKSHFYVPIDWLHISEDHPSALTSKGDFVYAKHGELLLVKRGMKSIQNRSTFSG